MTDDAGSLQRSWNDMIEQLSASMTEEEKYEQEVNLKNIRLQEHLDLETFREVGNDEPLGLGSVAPVNGPELDHWKEDGTFPAYIGLWPDGLIVHHLVGVGVPERFRYSLLGPAAGPDIAGHTSEQGASGPGSSLALAERCSLGRLGFEPLRCRRVSLHSRPTQPGRNNRDRRKDRWPCAGRLLEPVPPAGIRSKTEGIAPRALGRAGSLELGRGRSGRLHLVRQPSL